MWDELVREVSWFGIAVFRLIMAGVCGALIGWEREKQAKGAGLRTHILICLGATLFSVVGIRMHETFDGDLMRLLYGMLLAIGFMGGGLVFSHAGSVRGLTTAAGLWVVTGIGLAIGLGYYLLAIFSTFLTIAIVSWLRTVEQHMHRDPEAGILSSLSTAVKAMRGMREAPEAGAGAKGDGGEGAPPEHPPASSEKP